MESLSAATGSALRVANKLAIPPFELRLPATAPAIKPKITIKTAAVLDIGEPLRSTNDRSEMLNLHYGIMAFGYEPASPATRRLP